MSHLGRDALLFAGFLALAAFFFVFRPSYRFVAALMLMGALVELGSIFVDAPLDALIPRAIRNVIDVIWIFGAVIGISTIGCLQLRRQLVR